jgi:hypothetical protein
MAERDEINGSMQGPGVGKRSHCLLEARLGRDRILSAGRTACIPLASLFTTAKNRSFLHELDVLESR